MPVLSIIACGMLEDELAYVLSEDHEIKQLIIVENRNIFEFLRKLKSEKCILRTAPLDRVPMLLKDGFMLNLKIFTKAFASLPFSGKLNDRIESNSINSVSVVVNLLRLGLHSDLELLKAEVYKNIREIAPFSDGILIFYGTCGHVLGELEKDFRDLGCPLFFLRSGDGEIIEDCISAALGGNDAYARAMLTFRGKGTIYLTPMWASSWKKLEDGGSRDFNRRYLKNPRYCLAVKIDTGISYHYNFHKNVQEFAHIFGMKITELKGNNKIAEQSYIAAKEILIRKKETESRKIVKS